MTKSVLSWCCGGCFTYLSFVFLNRYRSFYRLEALPSPENLDDAYHILYNFMAYDYPLFTSLSLEIGFLKTYGIPSISSILAGSRELIDEPTKRIDDTNIIMREIIENPPRSERSLNAIRRMNALHGKYKSISNSDFLYVLAIFMCEPLRMAEKYGYRGVHPHEKISSFMLFEDMGREMGISNIFSSYEKAEEYLNDYEKCNMKFSVKNKTVAESSVGVFLNLFPRFLHHSIRGTLYALCTPSLRTAMGFPSPSCWVETFLNMSLHGAKWVVKLLLPPRNRYFHKRRTNFTSISSHRKMCPFLKGESDRVNDSSSDNIIEKYSSVDIHIAPPFFDPYSSPAYPNGYRITEIGPTRHCGLLSPLSSDIDK